VDENQQQHPIRLSQFAFACRVFGALYNYYDRSYLRFKQDTDGSPDLCLPEHRKALLRWLNAWGCRQFAVAYHDRASEEILSWYGEYADRLCPEDRRLLELTEPELAAVGTAYEALSGRTASYRERGGGTHRVPIGPAGASKVLFALRPRALLPWDDGIRKGLDHTASGASYVSYLRGARVLLENLAVQCHIHGLELSDLPQELGKPDSSLAVLLNEYYWVTLTKGCAPDSDTFQRWARWDRP